jgi:hypothetical protein
MERMPHPDQSLEGMTNSTGKARKAGPPPWEKYLYKEESKDAQESSPCDPRLELVLQTHGQHPDDDFIPSDDDPKSLHPVFGMGSTPDFYASDPSASDQGTLAGRNYRSLPQLEWGTSPRFSAGLEAAVIRRGRKTDPQPYKRGYTRAYKEILSINNP